MFKIKIITIINFFQLLNRISLKNLIRLSINRTNKKERLLKKVNHKDQWILLKLPNYLLTNIKKDYKNNQNNSNSKINSNRDKI